jgi:hypothetical protein
MKKFRIFFFATTLLLIIYIVAEYNKPLPLNWDPSLSYNDKIPFGTYITYRELNQIFPKARVENTNQDLYDQFNHNDKSPASNYLIISRSLNISKYDFKQMLSYIEKGNSVFISSMEWSGLLTDTLKIEQGYLYKSEVVGLNFVNNNLKQATDYKFDKNIANQYFSQFDTTRAVVLGKNEYGNCTFLCYKFGKGNLFLCANPEVFTNYSLLTGQGADYAAKALSYMPVSTLMYWDHFQNKDIAEDISPMRVFFSHASLQWAYYISLFSMVVFILYEMKRRQRIIPVIEPLKNSTIDFVNVVGQVYYEQRNNLNIAQKKILFFFEHLRTRYYVKTSTLDRDFIEKLSQKTAIEFSFVQELISHINYISVQKHITDHELIKLNQLIEQFYRKSA